jgi:dipeptidyl aminopeptidase/acylaminoacyl peptidase
MNADGSSPHALGGEQPIFGTAPAWSLDGTEIVFVGTDAELYLVRADGSSLRPLTQNDATNLEPAWSADSRWIAFESNMATDYDIYVIDRQGNNLYRVTHSTFNEHAPAWNPYTRAEYLQMLPACPENLPGRLMIGQRGRVISDVDLRIRPQPGLVEGEIGKMPLGSEFTVLEGPECADRLTWWKVDYQGVVGWVSEGRGVAYWVEPIKR